MTDLDGAVTINNSGADADFIVESDDHSHMLFVDAGNNAVGIKNDSPHDASWAADGANTAQLSIGNTSSGSTYGILHLLGHNTQATRYSIGAGDGIMYLAYDDVNAAHRIKVHADGDVEIVDGNINMASGHGIDFSAHGNAGGMSSELLDDYEEGTYTPTMFGVTTAGSVAYSSQAGWYTKVGRIVVAYFDIAVSSASGMAGTTALTLPVQSDNINAYMGVTYWDVDDDYFDGGKGASGYVYPNTTRIELYQTSDGAKGHNTGNTFKTNQTGRISGSVTYFSAT